MLRRYASRRAFSSAFSEDPSARPSTARLRRSAQDGHYVRPLILRLRAFGAPLRMTRCARSAQDDTRGLARGGGPRAGASGGDVAMPRKRKKVLAALRGWAAIGLQHHQVERALEHGPRCRLPLKGDRLERPPSSSIAAKGFRCEWSARRPACSRCGCARFRDHPSARTKSRRAPRSTRPKLRSPCPVVWRGPRSWRRSRQRCRPRSFPLRRDFPRRCFVRACVSAASEIECL